MLVSFINNRKVNKLSNYVLENKINHNCQIIIENIFCT